MVILAYMAYGINIEKKHIFVCTTYSNGIIIHIHLFDKWH